MPGYRGPSRSYQVIPESQDYGEEFASPLEQMTMGGRYMPTLAPRTDLLRTQRAIQADAEEFDARAAMDPSIRRRGPALTHMPSYDAPVSPYASPGELERTAMQPRRFNRSGRSYEYDPRLGSALDMAQQRSRAELNFEMQRTRPAGLDLAADDQRVQRLIDAGYDEKEATRQVFGRGGASVDEQKELIEARGSQQMERDQALQGLIRERQMAAQEARAAVQQLLERSRSGDKGADRELRGALSLLDSADREHAASLRARQTNAFGIDLGAEPPGDDSSVSEARQRVLELSTPQTGQSGRAPVDPVQAAEAAHKKDIAKIRARGGSDEEITAANAKLRRARMAAESGGEQGTSDIISFIRGTAPPASNAEPPGNRAGVPAPENAKPQAGAPAPAAPATKPRKPLADRVKELKAQGVSREEAMRILMAEGYDLEKGQDEPAPEE